MLVLVNLALNGAAPSYVCDLLTERDSNISLRDKRKLVTASVNTTKYGLHSFRCYATG